MDTNQEPFLSDALTSTLASFNYEYEELVEEQVNLDSTKQQQQSTSISFMPITTSTPKSVVMSATVSTSSTPLSTSTVLSKETLLLNDTSDMAEFRALMEHRRNESNEFRIMIVCIGLVIVSVGLLSNLIFGLLVTCPNKRRLTRTPTQLIMLSMCLAYFLFLTAYCLKISVYLSVDNIIKFHVYDSVENWLYGAFMCRLVSALPLCVKLISRFSLLLVAFRRLIRRLYYSGLNDNDTTAIDDFSNASPSCSLGENESDKLNIDEDGDMNILKRNRRKNKYRLAMASKRQATNHSLPQSSSSSSKFNWLAKFFRTPLVFVFVAAIWLGSALSSLPIFLNYKLDASNGICDSVYQFPEDIDKVSSVYQSYLIYGLVIPAGMVVLCLASLFVLNQRCLISRLQPASAMHSHDGSSLNSASDSPALKKITSGQPSSMISSTATLDAYYARARHNNFLLWLLVLVQLVTSLPPELYRYAQLRVNFGDDHVLNSYLESVFVQPIVNARPYYAMQLLYVSEFALVPLLFVLFYQCSTRIARKMESSVSTMAAAVTVSSAAEEGRSKSALKYASLLFYDGELSKLKPSSGGVMIRGGQQLPRVGGGGHVRGASRAKMTSINSEKKSHDALLIAASSVGSNTYYQSKSDKSRMLMKPTPFEVGLSLEESSASNESNTTSNTPTISTTGSNNNNNNSQLVHIIQHPSWRINIKQQQQKQQQQQSPDLINTTSGIGPVQLPFAYRKTSMYK